MKTLLLAALVLVACDKKRDAPPADPCATSINAAIDKMTASRGSAAPPEMTEIANKLRALMIERCHKDTWSADVLACFAAATDQPGIKKCRQQLPAEQAQALQMDIMQVMSQGARQNAQQRMGHGGMGGGSGGSAGGGAPEPAGSAAPAAAGSAGSGS